jgi:serine/threonine protein kinase/tetratricopeptide (TPR) repeat protein
MTLKTSCPENAHLKRFLIGKASKVEAASVQVHLSECEVCRAVVAGLMSDGNNGKTVNEKTGAGAESDHTCEIPAPPPNSATLSDMADGSNPPIPPVESGDDGPADKANGDHTCEIQAPRRESPANPPAVEDADASVVMETGTAAAPKSGPSNQFLPLDSATFDLEPEDSSESSILLPENEPPVERKPDKTCQLGVPLQELGTISDAADSSSPPSVQGAKGDPTFCLPDARSPDAGTAAIDPVQTGLRPPTGNANETCAHEPDGARLRPLSKGGLPSGERTLAGVVVPGYDILEELGRGGMGVVYKARDRRLHRLVALKMVLAGAHLGKMGLARFRAEAEAIAQLQHANIVQIYETGEHDGHPYFSLEYVEGGSLDQRMKESPTTPRAAAQVVETLARTIEMAHQRGIVHRDLKPANILLAAQSGQSTVVRKEQLSSTTLAADHWSRTMIPKIADFGLAKRVDDESGQTHTGTILGTPSYMAPEQASGKTREVGPAADIYALGAILYEMLTGRPPFKANNPIDTIRQVIEQEPVPPRQLEPRIPHDLETICLKCLEKEPTRRYASAAALADELRRFQDGEPIAARPTPAWERAWKWGKRRPAIVALLGVSLLAILGMVSFIVWHDVSLQSQLAAALKEERDATKREQDGLEEQRLNRLQIEAQKLFDGARIAVAGRDWASAQVHLNNALTTIGAESSLDAIKKPAETLLIQVNEELHLEKDRLASKEKFEKFAKLRGEAQFLGTMYTMYTGEDLADKLKEARATVEQTLELYGISAEGDGKLTPDAYLVDAQKDKIRTDCYQLLLILAETDAQSASVLPSPEKEKRLRKSLRILDRALGLGKPGTPPSRAYHVRRSRYLDELGEKADAAKAKKAAQDAALVDVFDHFLMADEFFRSARYDEANKEFEKVLQREADHFWAQYLNGLCLMRQELHVEARAQFSAAIRQQQDFVWLYLLRGFAQIELKAWTAAEDDFRKALQLKLDDYSRYVLLVNRGILSLRQDREKEAIADFDAAIKLKPRETMAFVNLASAYRQLKKFDLAVNQIDRALKIEPETAHLYRLRARLHVEGKEPALALKDFDRAIQLEKTDSPHHVGDHVERGRLLLRDNRPAEALASLEVALGLEKDHSLGQRLRAEALFHMAAQERTEPDRRARYQEVIDAFDRYLESGKPLESVYRGRGLARAELGQFPGAIDDFTKALELQPTSAVQAHRGWIHLIVEAPKLALRDFELAIELDAKNGDAYNGRGFVRATLGQYADAMKDADNAVRLGPASPRLLFSAARIHAQCPKGENRAVELILQSLRLLPAEQHRAFWSANIQTDRALQAIRRHPRFLQMENELFPRK